MLKRAVISTLQPIVANRVYTVRNGLARGLKRRGGLGFVPNLGTPPDEEIFLRRLNLDRQTVYDVGGNEGIFTLFFARQIGPLGRLITFEPNPHSHARIVENVRLNGFTNVEVRQLALGVGAGRATLVFPADEAARGSLVSDIQEQIRHEKGVTMLDIEVDSVDRLIVEGLRVPDFLKIDVEGFELDVLQGMSATLEQRHPRLYIEIHGADPTRKLENATAVMTFLWGYGYHIHHVESGTEIDSASKIERAVEGHVYCE